MSRTNKKQQETIIIKENTHTIFNYLFNFIIKLLGSIYNNILIYIIIFLLFIIAFRNFINIPLDLLLNYMYLPEFIQNFISVFQNNELPNATTQVIANINTNSLENAIKEVTTVQNQMLHLLEKQNETMISLHKALETLSVQQNTTVGLTKVVEQLQVNNKLTADLISLNKTSMKLTRATHDASMLKLSNFEQNIKIMFNKDFVSALNSNHNEYIACLQNNNSLLKVIQEQSINAYVLNQDLLAATNAATQLQHAGFEALLQSSTNNNEYLTKLQDHYYLMEGKLQQISKENVDSAERLKEELLRSHKELEKSTAIGFIKDKISNIDIEVHSTKNNK